jgi:hypothetical protein
LTQGSPKTVKVKGSLSMISTASSISSPARIWYETSPVSTGARIEANAGRNTASNMRSRPREIAQRDERDVLGGVGGVACWTRSTAAGICC